MNRFFLSPVMVISLFANFAGAETADRQMIFNEKIVPFTEWVSHSTAEAAILNLFPGFKEPTVEVIDSGVKKTKLLSMIVYSTRAKVIARRAAVNINLASLVSEQSLKMLDTEAKHRRIGANETMSAVVGKGPIANFKWCNRNPKQPEIFLPGLERSQAHMVRPGRPWCAPDSRTSCFESCRLVASPSAIETVIAAYNQIKSPGKDFGVATQTELRYYTSEAEFGAKTPLSTLTGVKTPVSGVLEVSLFYVNQVMLFGKMIIVLQANPADARETIVTGLTAFGVRNDAWNHRIGGGRVQAMLKSKSNLNTTTGILAGVPAFSRNALTGIAELIEK